MIQVTCEHPVVKRCMDQVWDINKCEVSRNENGVRQRGKGIGMKRRSGIQL